MIVWLVAFVVVAGTLLMLVFPALWARALQALWPDIVWRASTPHAPCVSLTFDDGPDPKFTPQVLAILRTHRIRATFFLAGDRARRYPEIVGAICKDGHEIANHSDSWQRTISIPLPAFEADLVRA